MSPSIAQTIEPMDYLIPPTQDLTIQFLTQMFGGVGSVLLGPQTIVGTLFEIFNLGILLIAGFLLAYTLSFNLFNEISSGQPLAHQYDIWTISRVVVGNSLLLPSYSGYSLIQIMVMQIVVYGVGLADSIWTAAINNVAVFGTGTTTSPIENETDYIKSILGGGAASASSTSILGKSATVDILWEMTVCAQAQYQHDVLLGQASSLSDYAWKINGYSASVGKTVNGKDCGHVTLDVEKLDNNQIMAAQNAFYNNVSMIEGFVESLYTDALAKDPSQWYNVLICTPNGAPYECQQGSEIAQVASFYYSALKPFAITENSESDSTDSGVDINMLVERGWATAAFYITYLTGQSEESSNKSTQTIDENKLNNMLFLVDRVVTYKSNTDDIYNNASQIYWILSTCTAAGSCGSFPYGSNSGSQSMNWAITKTYYITPATDVINASYVPENTSTENCVGNRYLDVAVATLYQNWLRYDQSHGGFSNMSLDEKSVIFRAGAKGGFEDINVGFNQRNLYVLLNKVLSDITGIQYFNNPTKTSYDDLTHNEEINSLSGKCGNDDVTGCFCKAASNKGLVTSGYGLMGAFAGNMTTTGQIVPVNPMLLIKKMGISMFDHGIYAIIQAITDAKDTTTQMAKEYFNLAMVISVPVNSFILYTSSFPAGVGAATITAKLMQGMMSMFQIFQLIDFQKMELYRGALSTFSSIIPLVGFILGIYVPLIPAFYFIFSVMGWLIAVIEGMIAAPIIALGLTYPKGHDLLGNSEQGIILLLQLFARPLSIVFGLMAGLLLSSIMFQLFNYMMIGFLAGYASSFKELHSDYQTGVLVGISVIIIAYAYISVVIVSNSYSLIYRLPDRVLRWIGAPIDPLGVAELVNEVRRGATDAMSKGLRGGAQTRVDVSATESARIHGAQPIRPEKD